MAKKKASIGDILEVKTPAGFAYLQYTHAHHSMGSLLRILPGLYRVRPADLADLARQKELYYTFYPLKYALAGGDVEIVSHQPIPDWAKPYPMMRASWGEDASGKTHTWMVCRADMPFTVDNIAKAPKYHELTPDLAKLSMNELWAHPVLVKQLAQGWTPERAEELRLKALAEKAARESAGQGPGGDAKPKLESERLRHYLYFPEKASAEKAAQWFRGQGMSVEVRLGGDRENWLALVRQKLPEKDADLDKFRGEMEALAQQLNGEYDGWEVAV